MVLTILDPEWSLQPTWNNDQHKQDIIKFLEDGLKGEDINSQDYNKETLLIKATLCGYPKIVELLLERGANKYLQDNLGKTALHYAVQLDIVKILVKNEGSDFVNIKDNLGYTALMEAVIKNNLIIAKLLIEHEANVNVGVFFTALTLAINLDHLSMVELLLKAGADVNFKSPITGETALMYAIRQSGKIEMIKLLFLYSTPDINAKDNKGMTALMHAKRFGNVPVINFLQLKCIFG